MEKWKQTIIENTRNQPNGNLLSDLLWLANGDDYDGGFTDRGTWEYHYLVSELITRLSKIGFLTPPEEKKILEEHGE